VVEVKIPEVKIPELKLEAGALLDFNILGADVKLPPSDIVLIPEVKLFPEFTLFDTDWLVEPIVSGLLDAAAAVWEIISDVFEPAFEWFRALFEPVAKFVIEDVPKAIEQFLTFLSDFWGWLTEEVPKAVGGAFTWVFEQGASIARTITSFISEDVLPDLFEALKWLADWLGEMVFAAFKPMWELLKTPIHSPPEAAFNRVEQIMKLAIGVTLPFAIAAIAGELVSPLKRLGFDRLSAIMFDLAGFSRIVSEIVGTAVYVTSVLPLRYALYEISTPLIPREEEVLRISQTGVLKEDEFYDVFRKLGFNRYWAELFWRTHWKKPLFDDLRVMMWRGAIDEKMFEDALRYNALPEEWIEAYKKIVETYPGYFDLRDFVIRNVVTEEQAKDILMKVGYPEWLAEKAVQAMFAVPREDEVAKMLFRKIVSEDAAREMLRKLGYPEEVHAALIESMRFWPREDDIRTWFLREYISEDAAKELLRGLGYRDEHVENIIKSWWVIPSISDLITFVVREVITPEEFYQWSKRMGLSEYWAKNYWEAHWRLPSFENLREAWWRGIITEEEFRKYIVWHDYKPEPRPGITKSDLDIMNELSYDLPGRIDVRWMVRWGVIGKDEHRKLIKMRGMHPEWADKVAEAEFLNQLLDERTRVLSALRRMYREGYISREELVSKLRELRYIEDEIELIVQASDYERELELRDESIKKPREETRADLVRAFRLGIISEEKLRELLRRLGYTEAAINLIVETERTLLALKEERERARLEEQLRKEAARLTADERAALARDWVKWFADGYLDEETLRARLEALGFSPEEVELRLQIARERYDHDLKEMLRSAYIAAYRADQIDEARLTELLTSLGLRSDYVAKVVEAERLRKRKERVEVETLQERLERLRAQEHQQLLYIKDLETDVEAKEKILAGTRAYWEERLRRLEEMISLEVDPAKRAKLEHEYRMTQIRAYLALVRAEEQLVDAKERLERARARLDEIRAEIESVKRALGAA